MAHWAVTLTAEQAELERLYEPGDVAVPQGVAEAAPGDQVAVLSDGRLIGLGVIKDASTITYSRRFIDDPPVADGVAAGRLTAQAFARLAGLGSPRRSRRPWMVSLDLPIEAATPAEAVRQFWTYLRELGPQELPAFVWPSGNELAMQAFVLGAEHNLDPEEDD
jgi:hypothetical protein